MLFGLVVRTGTFVINAGLMFLLAQQAPQLYGWGAHAKSGTLGEHRDNILAGLARVRTDLGENGKLIFPVRAEPGDQQRPRLKN